MLLTWRHPWAVQCWVIPQACTGCGCQIIHRPQKISFAIADYPRMQISYIRTTAFLWYTRIIRPSRDTSTSDAELAANVREENDAGMAFSNGDWTVRQCCAVSEWNQFSEPWTDSIAAIQRSSCCCGELLAGANLRSHWTRMNRNALSQLPTASPPLRYTRHFLYRCFYLNGWTKPA